MIYRHVARRDETCEKNHASLAAQNVISVPFAEGSLGSSSHSFYPGLSRPHSASISSSLPAAYFVKLQLMLIASRHHSAFRSLDFDTPAHPFLHVFILFSLVLAACSQWVFT